ncbi:MAG: sugar phosphate isomerase/epimerase [Anaerolineaceae bacterium]|nr:sugar phosphate isomerase/epimerase [Anaerolineaceae bacterium]
MNKIGIYYAYWTQEWDADFNPYIDKVADLGFDVLEVNAGTIATMTPAERKALKRHADARQIGLSYCIGLPAKFDVAAEAEHVRKDGIRFLGEITRGIGEMGGGRLSGILYGSWPALMPEGSSDKRPYRDRSVASIKEVIKVAEDNDVVFNMEVVNRFEQYLLNTAAEGVDYVKCIDSPNAKILLDTYHMNIEEDTIADAVVIAGSYLGHVHLGENNRKTPGYGHIPWAELANALKKINYQGWMVMEPFLKPGGQVGRDIRVFRDLSIGMDLDEEARKACDFMRKVLADGGIR